MANFDILIGDSRLIMPQIDREFHTAITSPPYFRQRDYGAAGQIGREKAVDAYVDELVELMKLVKAKLRGDGTLWLNLGDTFGPKKQLFGVPWLVAFALQRDGWTLRQDIIWHKTNPMPQPAKDRLTPAHEYIFLLTKGPRYYFDQSAIREPETCGRMRGPSLHKDLRSTNGNAGLARRVGDGYRNKRSVWTVPTKGLKGAKHSAAYPPDLIEPCVLAGSPKGGWILDPFMGAGTTGLVAIQNDRNCVGIEINGEFADFARKRIGDAKSALDQR